MACYADIKRYKSFLLSVLFLALFSSCGKVTYRDRPIQNQDNLNLDIVKNSSILIACPIDKNNQQLRSGTWSTIRKAKKHKLFVYIF